METINIHRPNFRPKCSKSVPVFRPKRLKKPYPLGRHIPIYHDIEEYPPGVLGGKQLLKNSKL